MKSGFLFEDTEAFAMEPIQRHVSVPGPQQTSDSTQRTSDTAVSADTLPILSVGVCDNCWSLAHGALKTTITIALLTGDLPALLRIFLTIAMCSK